MHLIFSNTDIESSLYVCRVYEQMGLREWKGESVEKDCMHSVACVGLKKWALEVTDK